MAATLDAHIMKQATNQPTTPVSKSAIEESWDDDSMPF